MNLLYPTGSDTLYVENKPILLCPCLVLKGCEIDVLVDVDAHLLFARKNSTAPVFASCATISFHSCILVFAGPSKDPHRLQSSFAKPATAGCFWRDEKNDDGTICMNVSAT